MEGRKEGRKEVDDFNKKKEGRGERESQLHIAASALLHYTAEWFGERRIVWQEDTYILVRLLYCSWDEEERVIAQPTADCWLITY